MKKKHSLIMLLFAMLSAFALTSCDDDIYDPGANNPYVGQWYDDYNGEYWTFSNNYLGADTFEGWIEGPGYTDYFTYSYDYRANRIYINYGTATTYVYTSSWDAYGMYLSNYDGTIYLQWVGY